MCKSNTKSNDKNICTDAEHRQNDKILIFLNEEKINKTVECKLKAEPKA